MMEGSHSQPPAKGLEDCLGVHSRGKPQPRDKATMPRHDLAAETKTEGRGGGLREREREYGRLIHLGHCPPYRWVTCHLTVRIIREGQRERDRQTDRQTGHQTDRQTETERQRDKERDRDTNRESMNRED